jgi:hypothetical protein
MKLTAKEYAKELVLELSWHCDGSIDDNVFKAYDLKHGKGRKSFSAVGKFAKEYHAKDCAKVTIDKLMDYARTFGDVTMLDIEYFYEVKKEIDLL